MAIAAPLLFLGYHMEDWRVAMALLIVPSIVNSAYYGPAYACVQGLVRPQARAVAADGEVLSLFDATRDDDRTTKQQELRFASDFGGPFNFVEIGRAHV